MVQPARYENHINFFESLAARLGEKQIHDWNRDQTHTGEQDVIPPANICHGDGCDFLHEECRQPLGRGGRCGADVADVLDLSSLGMTLSARKSERTNGVISGG
jgi:hypothetical protein